jgi:hypothetical protein
MNTANEFIAYCATDSGIDGREPERVLYASETREGRETMIQADKSKAWRSRKEVIVNRGPAIAQALAKLNGIDRLVLGLPAWPEKTGISAVPDQLTKAAPDLLAALDRLLSVCEYYPPSGAVGEAAKRIKERLEAAREAIAKATK